MPSRAPATRSSRLFRRSHGSTVYGVKVYADLLSWHGRVLSWSRMNFDALLTIDPTTPGFHHHVILGSRYIRTGVCHFFPGFAGVQVRPSDALPAGEYQFTLRVTGNDLVTSEVRAVVTAAPDAFYVRLV
jgi:hypothetical protein